MQGRHLDYLDGWRGLAIGFLLIGHFFPVPGINLGTFGVNLFFVLSGWLMSQLLFVQCTPISTFYRRRISRIFPTYFFFVCSITCAFLLLGKSVAWAEVVAASLLLNNYFTGDIGHAVMPFGHLWSLAVEEHSYIVLSLIAIASRKKWARPITFVGGCCVLFGIAGIWYWTQYTGPTLDFGMWLHSEVSAFGIFISAFFMLWFRRIGIPKVSIIAYIGLSLLAVSLHWWSIPNPVRTIVGVGTLALMVNCLPAAPVFIQRLLSTRPLRMMGLWSYSIYICQQPVYYYARSGGMSVLLGLLIALVCGLLCFYLIENPCRRYLNRVWTAN